MSTSGPRFDTPGQWPPTPWSVFDRPEEANGDARFMCPAWPASPNHKQVSYVDDDEVPSCYRTSGTSLQVYNVYLAIETFWSAWDHVLKHPTERLLWFTDYEIEGSAEFPSPGPPFLEIRRFPNPDSGESERWATDDPENLYLGLSSLGAGDMTKDVHLHAGADLKNMVESCLGKAYVTWWFEQQLAHSFAEKPSEGAKRPRPRV